MEETPSQLFERWSSRVAHASRELRHYEAKFDQFADAVKHHKERWERLKNETKNLIDRVGLNNCITESPTSQTQALNDGLPETIDNASAEALRSEIEKLKKCNAEIRVAIEKLKKCNAEIRVAMDRLNVADREYETLLRQCLEWRRCAIEPGERLKEELTEARINMEHVLYAIELGKTVSGHDAGSHIIKYVIRHPGASPAEICSYLDSKDIPLPTEDWKTTVGHKYGCALWKYSWEGDIEKGISADKKIRHRTRQYLWRYGKMANELRALYKIKRMLKLRKLQLPEIAA